MGFKEIPNLHVPFSISRRIPSSLRAAVAMSEEVKVEASSPAAKKSKMSVDQSPDEEWPEGERRGRVEQVSSRDGTVEFDRASPLTQLDRRFTSVVHG